MSVNIHRKVQIERYWADVFGQLREPQQIAKAVNPEFVLTWEHIRQFLEDCFVLTAQEVIIERWERIIGITPLETDTLQIRRNRILYMMNVQLPYTMRMLKHSYLSTVVGEGNYKVKLNPIANTIDVLINPSKQYLKSEIIQMLDVLLPCNLKLTLGLMSTPISMLEKYTHNQLANYTHDYIANELVFNQN